MTKQQAIKILKDHNKWRRGDENYEMAQPKELGQAIDLIIEEFEGKQEKLCVKGHDLNKENCKECGEC